MFLFLWGLCGVGDRLVSNMIVRICVMKKIKLGEGDREW